MEIIKSLSEGIFHQGHDVLSINLSYDIDDRGNNFLSCDIIHTHNEHKSVREIIDWYRYIEGKNYKDIIFIGHSRGAFNIIQAQSLINNKRIQSYLLAPVIDTYKGTKQYYMNEHNLPYDEVINSADEFIISDKHPPINFLFCENARVSSSTFRSYMDFSGKIKSYPFTFDLIDLIEKINSKVKIISGTDDEILLDSYKQFETIENENINHILIEGGDHFFRDIYMDDVLEIIFN